MEVKESFCTGNGECIIVTHSNCWRWKQERWVSVGRELSSLCCLGYRHSSALATCAHTSACTFTHSSCVGTVLVEQRRNAFWGVWCPQLCSASFLRKGNGMTCMRLGCACWFRRLRQNQCAMRWPSFSNIVMGSELCWGNLLLCNLLSDASHKDDKKQHTLWSPINKQITLMNWFF